MTHKERQIVTRVSNEFGVPLDDLIRSPIQPKTPTAKVTRARAMVCQLVCAICNTSRRDSGKCLGMARNSSVICCRRADRHAAEDATWNHIARRITNELKGGRL